MSYQVKRPGGFIQLVLCNVSFALIRLGYMAFFLFSPRVPDVVVESSTTMILVNVTLASFLLLASILAFFRFEYTLGLMVAAALVFFVPTLIQSALRLISDYDLMTTRYLRRTIYDVGRDVGMIIYNIAALFSGSVRAYFRGVPYIEKD